MRALSLEDFGADDVTPQVTVPEVKTDDRFDEGYNAGRDEALAGIEAEQSRISESLAKGLNDAIAARRDAVGGTIAALEPALREIFDKLLPHAAEKAFVGILVDELRELARSAADRLSLRVAPEETAAIGNLLKRTDLGELQVDVVGEPTLSMSQALIRWPGQERRIDLEETLGALDSALDAFLASATGADADFRPGDSVSGAPEADDTFEIPDLENPDPKMHQKEAING
ncbi:hypothetical protein JSE7799_03400 [Jannaschia seosinensis]|uniref:Flagellar assembly protein H n=1 Tax=Jannaschia seosinensis TaxID=313367 RepID=A0A0M7BGZ9_9RHOB|nr:hypothetical protein [Jannaschia seosinensis]CUH40665.1 hypothetical protein JSE7799_03400 [Jannaschia seosinensis]